MTGLQAAGGAELLEGWLPTGKPLLGICVGHDTLALRHMEAPATVLAVNNRMLGHNPLAAVQCGDSYFNYLKAPM